MPEPGGSCVAVVATDARLAPPQLERLARRARLALVRAPSPTTEAVLCSLWAAVDTTGREGRVARGLPRQAVLALYRGRGR